MVFAMKGKLLPLPTTPKEERLWKRVEIVCKNLHDEDIGVDIMLELCRSMYEEFASEECDFLEMQILSKLMELEAYLVTWGVQNGRIETKN